MLKRASIIALYLALSSTANSLTNKCVRFFVQTLLQKFPDKANLIYLFEDIYTGHVGRSEQDREAMFAALIAGIKESEYKPLVVTPTP